MTTCIPTTGEWRVTNAEYHAEHGWHGHSMLEVFRQSSVEFAAQFVFGTMPRPAPTAAMRLGTALHALVLEPDKWGDLIAVEPMLDRRTKLGKEASLSFESATVGKAVITGNQYDAAQRMAESVRAHPAVRAVLDNPACVRELAIRANDPETGLPLKCKPDVRVPAWLLDLKTAANPSPDGWVRQAANLGYARQAAHYRHVLRCGLDVDCRFAHIVVQSSEPWECACYYLEDSDLSHAHEQNAMTLNRLKACYESGVWEAPQNREILRVKLPKWTEFVG